MKRLQKFTRLFAAAMISITRFRHHQGQTRAQIALPLALRHSTLLSRVCRSVLNLVLMATLFVGLHVLLSGLLTLQGSLSQHHMAWFWPIGFVACIALPLYVSRFCTSETPKLLTPACSTSKA